MNLSERKDKFGEVFTPPELVNEILDKLWLLDPKIFQDKEKIFCDPACGNGNFLVEVLAMKLDYGHKPEQALSTIYGVDIQGDNVEECRSRLLEIVGDTDEHRQIVNQNIICGDSIKILGDSRYYNDYDFDIPQPDPYAFSMDDEIRRRVGFIDKSKEEIEKEKLQKIEQEKDIFGEKI